MNRGNLSSLEAAEANLAEQKSLVQAADQAIKDAYRKAHEAQEAYEEAKFQLEAMKRKNQIEEIFWRFHHIGEQILEQLDNKSVATSQGVSRWWQKFTDEAKTVWIRKIQQYISISNSSVRRELQKQTWNNLKELAHLLHFLFVRSRNDSKEITQTNSMLYRLISVGCKVEYEAHAHINKVQCRGCSKYNENILSEKSSWNYKERSIFLIKLITDNLDEKNPELKFGNSLLHHAAINGNLEVVKIVTNYLENKNPADQYGDTLLHTAATYGRIEICLFILEKITEKNPSNKYGATPFHVAADYGNYSVCRLILSNIQNYEPIDGNGKTPFQLAKEQGHEEVANLIKTFKKEAKRKSKKRKLN